MARNHLAKHAFDSVNHPTCSDMSLAFAAANKATIKEESETVEQRAQHRANCAKKTAVPQTPSPRRKSPPRERGLVSRSVVKKGGGRPAPSTAPSTDIGAALASASTAAPAKLKKKFVNKEEKVQHVRGDPDEGFDDIVQVLR